MEVLGLRLKKVGDNYWTLSGRFSAGGGDVDIQLTDSRASLQCGSWDLFLSAYDKSAPGCEAMAKQLEEKYEELMQEKSKRAMEIALVVGKLRGDQFFAERQAKVGASATFMAALPSHPSTENPPERSVQNAAKVDAAVLGVNHDAAYDAARHLPKPPDKGEMVGQRYVAVEPLRGERRRRAAAGLQSAIKQAKRWKDMALRYREEAHRLSSGFDAAVTDVTNLEQKLEERDESITDLVNKVEGLENRIRQQGVTIEAYQKFKDAILNGVKRKKVEKLLGRELAERIYFTHAPTVEAELKADEPIPYSIAIDPAGEAPDFSAYHIAKNTPNGHHIAALETKCLEYGKKIEAQEARLAERGQTIKRLEGAKHDQLSIIRYLERDKQQLNREIAELKNSTRDTLKTESDLRREIEVLRAETEAVKKAFATAPGADMSSYEARCNLAEALGRVKGLEMRLRDDPYDRPTPRLKKLLVDSQEHRRKLLKQRRALRREVTSLQKLLSRIRTQSAREIVGLDPDPGISVRLGVYGNLECQAPAVGMQLFPVEMTAEPYTARQGVKWRNMVLVKTSRLLHAASFGLVKFETEQDAKGTEGYRGWVWVGNRYWYSRGPSHQEALEAACAKAKPELGDTLHGLQVILR